MLECETGAHDSREPSNLRLMAGLRLGEARAMEAIMRRHNRMLFRLARAILKDEAEAEDVVQETYLRAFTHAEQCAHPERLAGWLAQIARNEALQRRRTMRRVVSLFEFAAGIRAELTEPQGEEAAGAPELPENLVLGKEVRQLLERAIDSLPEMYREVFILHGVEQLSTADTARCLGINQATVKTRFFRARKRLRRTLTRSIGAQVGNLFPFGGERCDRIVAEVMRRIRASPTSQAQSTHTC